MKRLLARLIPVVTACGSEAFLSHRIPQRSHLMTRSGTAQSPKSISRGRPSTSKSRAKHKALKTTTLTTALQPSTAVPWYTVFTKGDVEYNTYMATEWSLEKRGDVALFEKLSLEGAQSGLSWLTILRKRHAYRRVFHDFDIPKVAAMTESDVQAILEESNPSNPRDIVVRHRGKIQAVIHNAQCIQHMQSESTDIIDVLDPFLWSFVNGQPILNRWDSMSTVPTQTEESAAMSKALKQRGFKFVGPTTCYAFMQSVGMVIDHPINSPEWRAAHERLKQRNGGYQERNVTTGPES